MFIQNYTPNSKVCHSGSTVKQLNNSVTNIPIERSAENTMKLYEKLVTKDGEIPRITGDFKTRQGMTDKSITTSDQMSITITHSYINEMTWFLKSLYLHLTP